MDCSLEGEVFHEAAAAAVLLRGGPVSGRKTFVARSTNEEKNSGRERRGRREKWSSPEREATTRAACEMP